MLSTVLWYNGDMKNSKGQFTKGNRANPETEFKPGQHWRKKKPYWDRAWLFVEYADKKRSAAEIAADWGVTENAILFWLKKHDIPTRTMVEIRTEKHWGSEGESNGMYGRTGEESPQWKGGVTPKRQAFYSSREWSDAIKIVWERDEGICQRCRAENTNRRKMHIHHIVGYENEELIAEPSNLVLLCPKCHSFVHSKNNINQEFIAK